MYPNTQSARMNVRLKLSDFINTEYESIIMNKLSEIHSKLKATFYLRLWFDGNIKAFQKEVGKKLADVPSLIEQQVEIFKKNPKNVASQLAKAAGDINQFAKNTMKSAEQFGGLKSVKLLDPKFKLPGNKDEDPGG